MIAKLFKETFADKSTAILKLNISESTFVYALLNKEKNTKEQKAIQVHKKF